MTHFQHPGPPKAGGPRRAHSPADICWPPERGGGPFYDFLSASEFVSTGLQHPRETNTGLPCYSTTRGQVGTTLRKATLCLRQPTAEANGPRSHTGRWYFDAFRFWMSRGRYADSLAQVHWVKNRKSPRSVHTKRPCDLEQRSLVHRAELSECLFFKRTFFSSWSIADTGSCFQRSERKALAYVVTRTGADFVFASSSGWRFLTRPRRRPLLWTWRQKVTLHFLSAWICRMCQCVSISRMTVKAGGSR